MTTKSIVVNLELGHKAIVKHQKTSEGFTHDWEVFVQGLNGAPIEHYVEKVVFFLHESFHNPLRVMKSPPFLVREKGYGGFNLPIEVHFKAADEHHRKTKISYDLFLQGVDSAPIHHTIKEKITFFKPKEEFRKLLLLGGAIEETMPEDSKKKYQSSVSRPASGGKTKPRYDPNASSRNEQGDQNMRKYKNGSGKQESSRYKGKSKESSKARESSKRDKELLVTEKKVPGKTKYKEEVVKSNETYDRHKTASFKPKEQPKSKAVKAPPDTFVALFGETIRKGESQNVFQQKNGKKQQKSQPKAAEQVRTEKSIPKVEKSTVKSKEENNKPKKNDKFNIKDYYKSQQNHGQVGTVSQSKAQKKSEKLKESETAKHHGRKENLKPSRDILAREKADKGSISAKQVEQFLNKSPVGKLSKQQNKIGFAAKPEREKQKPATPPTPKKYSNIRRSSSSDSSSSNSRSRSASRSSECSSRSRHRSQSRSVSRQRYSRSQSRSSYSEKSRSRSPAFRKQKSLSKSPSLSCSRSDTAMSRSSSSSSCHSSISIDARRDSASVVQPATGTGAGPLGVLIQDIDGSTTESDEKGSPSSEEEVLPSMKKCYSKRRTSEMSSLPSSRQSSCHSGKGDSSSSEDEVVKQKVDKEKKRKKKLAAKARRKAEKNPIAEVELEYPNTPRIRGNTDKSDSEMMQDKTEIFTERAQRQNVELLERCRQLVINEDFDKIKEIMKIVGRQHSVQNGCVAIDYYKLSRMSQLRLKNYMERLDKPE